MSHKNITDHLLIENYLSGKLSGEETLDFEKNLISDKDIAEQTTQYKLAQNAIFEAGLSNYKEKLNKYHKENYSGNQKYWIVGIATLLGLSGLLYFSLPKESSKVFEEEIMVSKSHENEIKSEDQVVITKEKVFEIQKKSERKNQESIKDQEYIDSLPNVVSSENQRPVNKQIETSEPSRIVAEKSNFPDVIHSENKPEQIIPSTSQLPKIEYGFNPEIGETWNYPDYVDNTYHIIIYSKSGEIIFEDKNPENGKNWEATNVNQGTFLIHIYQNSNLVQKGYISVIK